MSAFFTIAQTGLSVNPIGACFGFLLLGGTLLVGVSALVTVLLRWWKPDAIPARLSIAAGAISTCVAVAFFGGDLARSESSPVWILLLGVPALVGGLLALWVSGPSGRAWFYAFATIAAVVVIADVGRMSLRAWRLHRVFDAADAGQTETVLRCIANGMDTETSNHHGRTILAAAVDGGHPETVKALLNAGANPNACCSGMLASAVIRGDENIVRALVEHGAMPTILFWDGESLLDAARRKSSPAIVKLLDDAENYQASPHAMVDHFYFLRIANRAHGLPEGRELEQLEAFLSERLRGLIVSAIEYREDFIKRHPEQPAKDGKPAIILEPPLAGGDYFTSLFEGPRSFKVKRTDPGANGSWNVRVHFWHERDSEGWEDVVVVTKEGGRYVVDDVLLTGAGRFNPGGRLSNFLKDRSKE